MLPSIGWRRRTRLSPAILAILRVLQLKEPSNFMPGRVQAEKHRAFENVLREKPLLSGFRVN